MGYNNEDKNNTLSIMTYTLNSGIKSTMPLSAIQIEEWKECYQNNKKFIVNVGTETFGLNPSLVADWRVHNKYSEHRKQIECIVKDVIPNELKNAYERAEVLIKVDCKCGTTYVAESTKRKMWLCSKCKEEVYIIGDTLHNTNKGKAFLMSNKLEMLKIKIEKGN